MTADPSADLLAGLPLVQRLALSYAPAAARDDTLTLLALDTRLAEIVRRRSEVLLAQLKLAWWRDRLREDRSRWPTGEPLLARLASWRGTLDDLVELVDGWEALLAEELLPGDVDAFATGRAASWTALARQVRPAEERPEVRQAAREWALADLALNLGSGPEAGLAREWALAEPWRAVGLGRALRPLAVLRGLAGRAMRRGSGEALDGPGAAMAALRIGLVGR